ncbi:MAG: hypothetical protein M1821_009448 [Bathelium mastoideum]|nr:MAG: hypothetical protein M1821_009448 [Bathelium mastoideum]KAI9688666.1 MAG: hypothetical protein M1822_001023 [Bathelium mastoideum]
MAFPFLNLPPELRLQVYTEFFNDNPIVLNSHPDPLRPLTNLRLTCQTINQEVKNETDRKATFCATDVSKYKQFCDPPLGPITPILRKDKGLLNRITQLTLSVTWTSDACWSSQAEIGYIVAAIPLLETLSIELWFTYGKETKVSDHFREVMAGRMRSLKVKKPDFVQDFLWQTVADYLIRIVKWTPPECVVRLGCAVGDRPFEPGTLDCPVRDRNELPEPWLKGKWRSTGLGKELWKRFEEALEKVDELPEDELARFRR